MLHIAILALSAIVSPTLAKEQSKKCFSNVGKTVAPVTFESLRQLLPRVERRGEFETTASFAARQATLSSVQAPVYVRQMLIPEYILYNADKGELSVCANALGAGQVSFLDVIRNTFPGRDENYFTNAVALVVASQVISEETYPAINAFGAKFDVARSTRRLNAIWDRPGKRLQSVF